MIVVKLSDNDHTLLAAAHAACKDAEESLSQAHKNNKREQAIYSAVLEQLRLKYKMVGSPSDDHRFLIGRPLEAALEEPASGTI